jgi:peptidoglycan hydrolase-like protein with peptidoglycan-binding domain
VPFVFDGHSFPAGVAYGTGALFSRALDTLCAQPGFTLPTSRSLDAGMWGYEDRRISGTNQYSFHAYGLALDIAAPWNPRGATPVRTMHRLPANTGELLRDLGFEWGGDWSPDSLDYMHIELHLSPDELARMVVPAPASTASSSVGGFPLPAGCYYGPYEGPAESISGSGQDDARWRPGLVRAQQQIGVLADGYYGPITAAAVRRWQGAHGLEVDGLIGPLTWATFVG